MKFFMANFLGGFATQLSLLTSDFILTQYQGLVPIGKSMAKQLAAGSMNLSFHILMKYFAYL
jgi:hypothetical protein